MPPNPRYIISVILITDNKGIYYNYKHVGKYKI